MWRAHGSEAMPVHQSVVSLTPVLPKKIESELQAISREISWYEEEVRKTVKLTLQYKVEIGKRLARAKVMLPHGQFIQWCQNEFNWTQRHVQNHLVLAANEKRVSHLPAGASLRMALAAIKELEFAETEEAHAETKTKGKVEVLPPPVRLHIFGEVLEGAIDCEQLIEALTLLATRLGAPLTRWTIKSREE
jgi:hypothetical protein